MYSEKDTENSIKDVKLMSIIMGIIAAVYIAGYVMLIRMGNQWLMLLLTVIMFGVILFFLDMYLLPSIRYRLFLKQVHTGLSHETDCRLVEIEPDTQLQDGCLVKAVHVVLEDSSERLFYISTSKEDQLPEMGSDVHIVRCGRHILSAEVRA